MSSGVPLLLLVFFFLTSRPSDCDGLEADRHVFAPLDGLLMLATRVGEKRRAISSPIVTSIPWAVVCATLVVLSAAVVDDLHLSALCEAARGAPILRDLNGANGSTDRPNNI